MVTPTQRTEAEYHAWRADLITRRVERVIHHLEAGGRFTKAAAATELRQALEVVGT